MIMIMWNNSGSGISAADHAATGAGSGGFRIEHSEGPSTCGPPVTRTAMLQWISWLVWESWLRRETSTVRPRVATYALPDSDRRTSSLPPCRL
jgi:hypothetical protein